MYLMFCSNSNRYVRARVHANGLTIRCKDFVVTSSSCAMNDSKRPVAVSLNALSMFDNALTMF